MRCSRPRRPISTPKECRRLMAKSNSSCPILVCRGSDAVDGAWSSRRQSDGPKLRPYFRCCEGFRTPAADLRLPRIAAVGVGKPAREETAGWKAWAVRYALWGFDRRGRCGELTECTGGQPCGR